MPTTDIRIDYLTPLCMHGVISETHADMQIVLLVIIRQLSYGCVLIMSERLLSGTIRSQQPFIMITSINVLHRLILL